MLLKHTAVRKCHACPFNLICSYSQTNCVDGTFFEDIFFYNTGQSIWQKLNKPSKIRQ